MTQHPLRSEPLRQHLTLPNQDIFRQASLVVSQLREAGYQAFLVGGVIRDSLMGSIPKDCDITTNALPKDVVKLFPRTVPVGIQFGTIMVLQEGHHFEVTTFRADGRYEDGRRPTSVSFSQHITDDLERRDLTINGLIYAPEEQEVIDYTGGLEDIKQRLIRTIGPPQDRFHEDRLRMLRAVRFASRLSFQLDTETFAAIRERAHHLPDVSVERIQQELLKILTCCYPARGILLLEETGLLPQIIPELPDHNAAVHRLLHYESLNQPNEDLALALLLADLSSKQAEQILRGLRFPGKNITKVAVLLEQQQKLQQYCEQSKADRKRFLRQPHLKEILEVGSILKYTKKIPTNALSQALTEQQDWSHDELSPAILLDGHRLKQCGYPPSSAYKTILTHLEDEQLQGNITTLDQALAWLQEHYGHLRNE